MRSPKTLAIRFKQAAFHSFNAVKNLLHGQISESLKKLASGTKFLFSEDDYWCFDRITASKQPIAFAVILISMVALVDGNGLFKNS